MKKLLADDGLLLAKLGTLKLTAPRPILFYME